MASLAPACPARTGQRRLPFPAPGSAGGRAESRAREAGSHPTGRLPRALGHVLQLRSRAQSRVDTESVDTEVVPGQAPGASQGRAAPRRRGSGRGVFAGTVRKRRLDPGRGMTVGSGHAWGQLPRDLTEPDPAEVKQGLDAHARGSRHWGRCTGESRNRGARGPCLSPGFWASWKL